MEQNFFQQGDSLSFKRDQQEREVEIGEYLIDKGFLSQFPGSSLALFLFLAAKRADKKPVKITLERLNCLIPGTLAEVRDAVDFLQECDLLNFNQDSGEISLQLKPENLIFPGVNKTGVKKNCSEQESEIINSLLDFFPGEKGEKLHRQSLEEVQEWVADFPPELLQELLKRLEKWLEHPQNPEERAHYYLRAIISDWYEKGIFSLNQLKEYDRLYRETKTLAQIYGFKSYHQLNPVQLETLQSWLTGEKGLSLEVACWAVKQAVRQKRDGSPSLEYIERNYIEPLQKEAARNIKEAAKIMANDNRENDVIINSKSQEDLPESDWEELVWGNQEG